MRDQAQSDCVRNLSIDLELKGFQSGYKINMNQPTQSDHGLVQQETKNDFPACGATNRQK